VVLKPNSSGQETVKARTHTVPIITDTLFLERYVMLYRTGITTAVYLKDNTHIYSLSRCENERTW